MDIGALSRGVLIGFSIAAPVGPIGVLCIRRTLADGRGMGLATGLGAATADACYGAIAGFSITALSGLLLDHRRIIRLVGGLFLCYLGLKTFLTGPAARAAKVTGRTALRAYLSAVALTLTNPATILSFVAIFAGLGVGTGRDGSGAATLLVVGVFVGSALWWVLLSGSVFMLGTQLGPRHLRWVNRLSGGMLLGFGLLAFVRLR